MTTELFQFQLKHALLAFYVVIFFYFWPVNFRIFLSVVEIQFGRLTKQAQINTEDDKTVLAELKKNIYILFQSPQKYININ